MVKRQEFAYLPQGELLSPVNGEFDVFAGGQLKVLRRRPVGWCRAGVKRGGGAGRAAVRQVLCALHDDPDACVATRKQSSRNGLFRHRFVSRGFVLAFGSAFSVCCHDRSGDERR